MSALTTIGIAVGLLTTFIGVMAVMHAVRVNTQKHYH
jgi:hypothetical protein